MGWENEGIYPPIPTCPSLSEGWLCGSEIPRTPRLLCVQAEQGSVASTLGFPRSSAFLRQERQMPEMGAVVEQTEVSAAAEVNAVAGGGGSYSLQWGEGKDTIKQYLENGIHRPRRAEVGIRWRLTMTLCLGFGLKTAVPFSELKAVAGGRVCGGNGGGEGRVILIWTC